MLSKTYIPNEHEDNIYALWEKSRAFEPKSAGQRKGNDNSYSVVVPPPNANGDLHIGHALTLAIEDIAVRYHRMQGKAALLLPGADHAGFETQVVYEKKLAEEGKSRFNFTREELYNQIWDFVAENKTNYESQFRKLGASVDWSRYVFTLDQKIINQAYDTFKKMWDEGLIYRGERLVNFCTHHGTGFADIEVAYKETKGHMWHIRYPLTDSSGEIIVATTRPETMLGDTAVAVHPKDPRYKKFIGKTISLPLTKREIPILADEMVDTEFGTGAVKITPAHDPNDYEVAGRHDLPMISVIDHEGKMTHEAGDNYRGLSIKDARKKVINDLQEQGYLAKKEVHVHSVGHCYKCGTVIEPLLREQWFIDMQPLSQRAIEVLKQNKIKFYPESKKDQLIAYLEGLRDWNISRQIAWGIPIPAFQNVDEPDDWIFDTRVDKEQLEIGGKIYRRDPDVFDTWFSSSSWPYATLDYPKGEDFEKFYPLSVMETGYDIMYPWVSRMIMMGLYVTDQIPFERVYLHGLVLDEHGAKMSKSKGNVINPLEMVKIYGSDALRMGIITGQTAGNNQPFTTSRVVGARNFCNKLWNIARYTESALGSDSNAKSAPNPKTIADHWVLSKLQQSIDKITDDLENYRFAEAYETVYHLVWDDVADWYIEASKGSVNQAVLAHVLETILKLAHPFAPFVTEAVWQTLDWSQQSVLAAAKWSKTTEFDTKQAQEFEEIMSIVTEIRYINSTLGVRKVDANYGANEFIRTNSKLIKKLANLNSLNEGEIQGLRLTQTPYNISLIIDKKHIQAFASELASNIKTQEKIIANFKKRLANKSYVANAPKKIVDETKAQLEDAQKLLESMQTELGRFAK